MSLRSTIRTLETRFDVALGKLAPIVWLGPQGTQAAAAVEDLQRRGRRVRMIVLSLMLVAKNEDKAHELIRQRRAAGDIRPITVSGPCPGDSDELPNLVHDDGAPEWLAAKPVIGLEAS